MQEEVKELQQLFVHARHYFSQEVTKGGGKVRSTIHECGSFFLTSSNFLPQL